MDVSLDPCFDAFSVAAIVTPPGEASIETRGFWVGHTCEDVPGASDLQRREAKPVFVLRRSEVPVVPLQTVIEAADYGTGTVRTWLVDGFDRVEADHVRAIVIPLE